MLNLWTARCLAEHAGGTEDSQKEFLHILISACWGLYPDHVLNVDLIHFQIHQDSIMPKPLSALTERTFILIKIFFQQSASETHHSLGYWPSINNWILKICPKVQDLNSYLSEVMICSNNIEWKVQEEKIFLLQSMHNAVTLVSAFAVKNFSISCDLCLTLMFYQNQNPSHQLEFWQFKLESQITQW